MALLYHTWRYLALFSVRYCLNTSKLLSSTNAGLLPTLAASNIVCIAPLVYSQKANHAMYKNSPSHFRDATGLKQQECAVDFPDKVCPYRQPDKVQRLRRIAVLFYRGKFQPKHYENKVVPSFYNSIIRFTVFPSHKLCFLRSFPVTM